MPRLTAANTPLSPAAEAALDAFFATRGQGFNAYLMCRDRRDALARLDALPDAALFAMGLTRARIPGYVFRDILPSHSRFEGPAMTDLPPARSIRRAGEASAAPSDRVTLSYDDRFLRRKRLETDAGDSLLVDLAETVSLEQGDRFVLEDGREVAIAAAEEPLIAVTGDLPRLAWHIGNRHTPCQVEAERLLIRRDHVLEDMLRKLGADIALVTEPFRPEGGAYGHGRTMGHDHGHDHAHGHVHHHVSHYHPDEDDEDDGEPETIR